MASDLILGIHGFGPKPPRAKLTEAWRASIEEGLRRNCGYAGPAGQGFDFELIYWADLVHLPLVEDPQPYLPAQGDEPLPEYHDDWKDELLADLVDCGERVLDRAMLSEALHRKTGWVLEWASPDCERYNQNDRLRTRARGRLEKRILEARRNGRRILLIGHSIGSVISYELLRFLEERFKEPVIEHFLSVGSPLGFSFLTRELLLRHRKNRVPETLRAWTNFTDRKDLLALDAHLADDYTANRHGVELRDDLVINTYFCPEGRLNAHKAYGYLRAPEVSREIAGFLGLGG